MNIRLARLAIVLGLVFLPRAASADIIVTPFVGADFGGDLDSRLTCGGASVTFMGRRLGLELDLSYAPDLSAGELAELFVGSSSLASAMANLVVAGRSGSWHPYVSGGAGVIRARATVGFVFGPSLIFDNRDFGLNLGGGATGYFSRHFGVRGDFRWFRVLAKDDHELFAGRADYYRGSAGLAIRF